MKRTLVRPIAAAGIVGIFVLVALLAFWSRTPRVPKALPQPNGYEDFLKAGQMLDSGATLAGDLSLEELRASVLQDAQALRLARAGLQKQSAVTLGYSTDYMSSHLAELAALKRLARGFVAEGKLAEREDRLKDAVAAYLDAIRLGHEGSRGGVMMDMLVGVACRAMGCQSIKEMASRLSAADCREAIRALESMDAHAESAAEISENERTWSRRTFGLRGRFAALVMRRNMRQNEQRMLAKVQAQQQAERLLKLALAARADELDRQ